MTEQDQQPTYVTPEPAITKEEKNWAMFCHLAGFALIVPVVIPVGQIVAPLVLWLLKKEGSPFIDDQGREALNFQISMTIYFLASILLMFIIIGIPLFLALIIFDIVMIITAADKASKGEHYRYPFNLRLVK
jgi:hypothetical protein